MSLQYEKINRLLRLKRLIHKQEFERKSKEKKKFKTFSSSKRKNKFKGLSEIEKIQRILNT